MSTANTLSEAIEAITEAPTKAQRRNHAATAHAALIALAEENGRLRAALRPFAEFARRFNLKPIPNTERADILYGIHAGDKSLEADLRLADCRTALKALEGT